MSTASILAVGLTAQSLAWPAAAVIVLRHFSSQLRVAAPPREKAPRQDAQAGQQAGDERPSALGGLSIGGQAA